MTSDSDRNWQKLASQYRRYKRLLPMTPEEADEAFDEAPAIPMSGDEIRSIVDSVTSGEELEWEESDPIWEYGPNTEGIEQEMLALYREQGQEDPEAAELEEELRKKLLKDEQSENENGMAGGASPPG